MCTWHVFFFKKEREVTDCCLFSRFKEEEDSTPCWHLSCWRVFCWASGINFAAFLNGELNLKRVTILLVGMIALPGWMNNGRGWVQKVAVGCVWFCFQADSEEVSEVVSSEVANRMSLFYACPTPMLKTISDSTTKFIEEVCWRSLWQEVVCSSRAVLSPLQLFLLFPESRFPNWEHNGLSQHISRFMQSNDRKSVSFLRSGVCPSKMLPSNNMFLHPSLSLCLSLSQTFFCTW